MFVSLINCSSSSLFHCFFVVCRDGSCVGSACLNANIGHVVGPSCTGGYSCTGATIGSVDSSCNDEDSCNSAQLSGVDLINSCNKVAACIAVNGNGVFDELINCCNDAALQCYNDVGFDIVNAGCVSYMCI